MWAIKGKDGKLITNVLEISEGWAWAVLYANCGHPYTFPNHIPPSFLEEKKAAGLHAVQMMEVDNTRRAESDGTRG